MPDYGLTSTGLVLPRGSEVRTLLQTRVEAELAERGEAFLIDWDRDTAWGVISVVVSQMFGELYEIAQAIYDARSENNASGVTLADIGAIVGVEWVLATASTVTLTLAGTAGTVIGVGKVVRDTNRVRWVATESVTLDGSGAGSGVFEAETLGRVLAEPNTVTTIVTPVAGWTSATNAAAAIPGVDQQTDAQFRRTRRERIARGGSMTRSALRAQVLGIDGITDCCVVSNTTGDTSTIQGIDMPADSIAVVVYPSTLTDEVKAELATTIEANTSLAGTESIGDETADVTTGGITVTVAWQYAAPVDVRVRLTGVVVATGYTVADMLDPVTAEVEAAFDELGLGDGIYALELSSRFTTTTVPGLRNATVEFSINAGADWTAFVDASAIEKITLELDGDDEPVVTVAA